MSAFEQAGVSKRELFQENIIDVVAAIHDPSLDGHDPDAASDPNKVANARADRVERDVHDGVLSGSIDGVRGGTAERVADNRDSKEAKAARDEQRANDTAFYLGLMADLNDIDDRIRALDDEIDHLRDIRDRLASGEIDVAEASRDEQVRAAIEAWEEETGRTFNPTADDAEEILLSIVDGAISKREAARSGLEAQRRDVVEQIENAQTPEEEAAVVEKISDTSLSNTRISGVTARSQDAQDVVNTHEDDHSDSNFDTALPGPAFSGALGGGLDGMKGQLAQTFAANAADVTADEPTQTASLEAEEQQQIVKNDLINPVV